MFHVKHDPKHREIHMNDNDTTATAATRIDFTAVEQPMKRTGRITVVLTVEATSLESDAPSAEAVVNAVNELIAGGVQVRVPNTNGRSHFYTGTPVTVTGVTLA